MAINPGDIAFVGANSVNPDVFAIIVKNAIAGGETFIVTDGGFISNTGVASTSFRSSEGFLQYTAPAAGLPAGTILVVTAGDGVAANAAVARNGGGAAGSVTLLANSAPNTTNFSFSNSGDSLTAYTVSGGTHLTGAPTLIAFVNFGPDGSGSANAQTSAIPTITGGQVLDLINADNFRVNNTTSAGTLSIADLSNAANFSQQETTRYDLTAISAGSPAPTTGDDTLTGTTGDDTVDLLAGNDTYDGGAGNDTINGGEGNDIITGGTGNDTMTGGAGNDFYFVDSASDLVIEISGEGTGDKIIASVDVILADAQSIEIMKVLDGSGAHSLTGNASDNTLVGAEGNDTLSGGGGNDTLDGRAGADAMSGGAGNDRYYVDNAGDTITENTNEGTADSVIATTNYTLGAGQHIESLIGRGNGLMLGGNERANAITGTDGADIITGGGGNDSLVGRAGADTFAFGDGWGRDSIRDFVDGTDVLDFTDVTGLDTFDQLTITQSGSRTIIAFAGQTLTLVGVTASGLAEGTDILINDLMV